ncbi:hypothetical protein ACSBR1_028071 [Camellia fascicularis]
MHSTWPMGVFNDGIESTAWITIKALISECKHGFDCIGSLVDVGGGTGASIAGIVKAYPHVKGTNFDLPHVVATAPPCPGVNHVGGDMFSNIPTTDAIFMKVTYSSILTRCGVKKLN